MNILTILYFKRCLLPGRKAMTNLDSTLKSRDITLLIKVHIVKAMVFQELVMDREVWRAAVHRVTKSQT